MLKINHSFKPRTCCSFVFLLCFCLGVEAQKNVEYVLPTSAFNKEEAYKMLDEGNNSIEGTISLKKRGYVNYPGYLSTVLLYPVTPHLTEFIELNKKYNSRKKQAAMTKEAAMVRIETKTIDSKGNFVFTNLKPGKYYIVSLVTWEKVRANKVQSGPVSANYNMLGIQMGGGHVPTETRYESQAYEKEVGDYIEVSGNNKITTVNIAQ
ncbi:prealbumin-like fold domain-containing protein [Chryseobacterium angstadtii]|uniref:prealbumin-like fold domain-containing protein n=1 Tax=Chryseobacterium angstadtii TaxID=558151 RepID=UPI000A7E0801|nr:prealbumin-like fold domain-containing protein [Chryseobacterium angstadtii]